MVVTRRKPDASIAGALERLLANVGEASAGSSCRIWRGYVRQKRRGFRGAIWIAGRYVNSHRALLILTTGPVDVPHDGIESFHEWFRRATRHYRGLDASHACDEPLCHTVEHLKWQTNAENNQEYAQKFGRFKSKGRSNRIW